MQSPTAMRRYGANQGELQNGVFRPTGSICVRAPDRHRPLRYVSWKVGEKVELAENKGYRGDNKPKLGQDHRPPDLDRHWPPAGAPVR